MMKTQQWLQLPLLILFLLLLRLNTSAATSATTNNNNNNNNTGFIRTSCNATLYPEICYTSLSGYASTIQQNPAQLALFSISVSLTKTRRMAVYVSNLSRQAAKGSSNLRIPAALHDCFANFGDAVDEMKQSFKEMRHIGSGGELFRFQMSNVQTWMSAALTYEETCTDGFEGVPDAAVKADVCSRAAEVKKFTSNALALVNTYADKGSP